MTDEIVNEVKNSSQTSNMEFCSNCQNLSIKNYTDYPYLVKSYQRLFYKIKEELLCPISFSRLNNPIFLDSGHTISKRSYKMLTQRNLNNPFTRQPIVLNEKIIKNYTVSRILKIVRKFDKITPKVHDPPTQEFFNKA